MFPILLASASPRRRQLLEQVGFVVSARPADVDETPHPDEPPRALAARLARAKAVAALEVATQHEPAVGVAADTVVWHETEAYGKPADRAEAAEMLRRLSGRRHIVSTAVCVFERSAGVVAEEVVDTEVEFRALSEGEIGAYVTTDEPLDKAGGYGIQGLGAVLVRGIVGSYTNVVGLPVERVVGVLRERQLLGGMPWEAA